MLDPVQDATFWTDGSIFEDLLAGPGRQPYEWPMEDVQQNGINENKQLLSLHELTPEPDPSLLMPMQQLFEGGFQEFYPQGEGSEMAMQEMDMAAFFQMQAQAASWNRRGNQKEESWRRDRERWYSNNQWYRQPTSKDDPPYKAAKAGKELRTLLDFYYEPFNLQHNKFMLELIMTKVGMPRQALLSKNTLAELRFDLEELKGLNRLYSCFERVEYGHCKMVALDDPEGAGFKLQRHWIKPGQSGPSVDFHLTNLRFMRSGEFMLRKLAEVRSFNVKEDVDVEGLFARFMSAPVDMEEAPKNKFVIASLNCSGVRERSLAEESLQSMEGRIRRQVMLYQPDLICIQGLDPWQGRVGFGLASSLMETGYQVAASGGEPSETSTIFYHEKRFELVSSARGLAVADLKFLQADAPTLRVACIRAEVPPSIDLQKLLNHEAKALVVVADCLPIGGAEILHMVQELAELRSAYRELAKEEVYAPVGKWDPVAGCQRAEQIGPTLDGSSGLLKLHSPDCILYSGAVDAIATLAGHSPMYITTMGAEEASAQFPTFRMPLLSVFQWRPSPQDHEDRQQAES